VSSSSHSVGDCVGDDVGKNVTHVGGFVGDPVGTLVGFFTGVNVGDFVGDDVGKNVTHVGGFVGDPVGTLVGFCTGVYVGDFVGDDVGKNVTHVGGYVGGFVTGVYVGGFVGSHLPQVFSQISEIKGALYFGFVSSVMKSALFQLHLLLLYFTHSQSGTRLFFLVTIEIQVSSSLQDVGEYEGGEDGGYEFDEGGLVGFFEGLFVGFPVGATDGSAVGISVSSSGVPHFLHVCLQISPSFLLSCLHFESLVRNELLSMSHRLESFDTHSQIDTSLFLTEIRTHSLSSSHIVGATDGAVVGKSVSSGVPHFLHVCLHISPSFLLSCLHFESLVRNELLSMSHRLKSFDTHSQMDTSLFLIGIRTHSLSSSHIVGAID